MKSSAAFCFLQVASASFVRRSLFKFAYSRKLAKLKAGAPPDCAPLMNALVFQKFRAALGGEVREIITGAAPISREVEEFLRVTMCVPVLQVGV